MLLVVSLIAMTQSLRMTALLETEFKVIKIIAPLLSVLQTKRRGQKMSGIINSRTFRRDVNYTSRWWKIIQMRAPKIWLQGLFPPSATYFHVGLMFDFCGGYKSQRMSMGSETFPASGIEPDLSPASQKTFYHAVSGIPFPGPVLFFYIYLFI